ncbi:probable RNA polymerase sigma-H factor [Lentisphaera araneosa HTCC2155]|uniref:Probable RNA polymerase sigma-H factor n=1 Tax=Lentisphaera araneosa HTCC2155 TaxID=313628 RepID=A6DLL7_9BACT|nr:sigma-70 family RNA polymerase sigma factor [Lentisphaera araneosa]EDM27472.1 probable RNA polymerase sigma-H factor [Lentisphaera araneosa HTCC2155]
MFTTRRTLLQKLNMGSQVAWDDFDQTYRKLILLRGRDRGLSNDELDDLVQIVLINIFKSNSIFKYDGSKGRFRDYLKTIIDRRSFDLIRKRKNALESLNELGDKGIVLSSDDHEVAEKHWEEEWQKHLLEQAIEYISAEVQPQSITIFRMLAQDHMAPEQVAEELDINVDAVYVVKHRMMKRIKPVLKQLDN